MEKFTQETVIQITRHTDGLLTFTITRPESFRFSAGQFARLGFRTEQGLIWRAYSVLSSEYEDTLSFMAVLIPNGQMSAQFQRMQTGDVILLDKTATGFLLPHRFVGGTDLIMLSTGSGIAPFLSQIGQPETWQRFPRIVLTHCVRYTNELIFNQWVHDLQNHPLVGDYAQNLIYIPITTRDHENEWLHHRLPETLKNGTLQQAAGFSFNKQNSRFMICGNPAMVDDTFSALKSLGFSMHRNKLAGEIIMENGF